MFVDASLGKNSNSTGCGAVLHRADGRFSTARCWPTVIDSVGEAEAQALLAASEWAHAMKVRSIIFISDNLSLVQALNGDLTSIPWTLFSYVQDCKSGFSLFNSSQCKYVPQNQNGAADALARLARKSHVNSIWDIHPPVCIVDKLLSML